MINNKKIVVVLPAYNASQTLEKTYREIPHHLVDEVILVDDYSKDNTSELGRKLGIKHIFRHEKNLGYGGNQKTCYKAALNLDADIVLMLHPDYQYTPLIMEAMLYPIAHGVYDVMLGSRILGKGALKGGMPIYKYIANRFLTLFQNILMSEKLSEYHTGYRAFTRETLLSIPYENNSDDFIFDNQFLAQVVYFKHSIGEVSCPTKYFAESSSINFKRSLQYGLGVVFVSIQFRLNKWKVISSEIFKAR